MGVTEHAPDLAQDLDGVLDVQFRRRLKAVAATPGAAVAEGTLTDGYMLGIDAATFVAPVLESIGPRVAEDIRTPLMFAVGISAPTRSGTPLYFRSPQYGGLVTTH